MDLIYRKQLFKQNVDIGECFNFGYFLISLWLFTLKVIVDLLISNPFTISMNYFDSLNLFIH